MYIHPRAEHLNSVNLSASTTLILKYGTAIRAFPCLLAFVFAIFLLLFFFYYFFFYNDGELSMALLLCVPNFENQILDPYNTPLNTDLVSYFGHDSNEYFFCIQKNLNLKFDKNATKFQVLHHLNQPFTVSIRSFL